MKNFEVIVIGVGAVGSAALYQLSKKGKRVLGIDQFSPPHTFGSSHGDSRMTRQAVGEGVEYVPLVLRSNQLWRQIEKESGQQLLTVTGGLIISYNDRQSDFFDQTVRCARQFGIDHSLLGALDIKKKFPQFVLKGNERGYFEPGAGFLRPEACIRAQQQLAKKQGAQLALNEKVVAFIPTDSGVTVTTNKSTYTAETVIIAAGSWVSTLLGDTYASYFSVYRQVLYWFDAGDSLAQFSQPYFPVWIWELGDGLESYGFPAIGGGAGVKLATEQYTATTVPDKAPRRVSRAEAQYFYDTYVKNHFAGLSPKCLKATTCLYTVTPDHKFVIDTHPDSERIIIASPCSGHGFKHSAAVGEILAEMATGGKPAIDIAPFALGRFAC